MKSIAVFATDIVLSHIRRTVLGMRDYCETHDCRLFIFTCEREFDPKSPHMIGEYAVFSLPDIRAFDGAIIMTSTLFSTEIYRRLIARVQEAGLPAVTLEGDGEDIPSISIDNYMAMSEIVEHMIVKHGYRVINFIGGPEYNTEAQNRLAAYRDTLERHGIAFEPERVYHGNYLKSSGEAAVRMFLRSKLPMPRAIVASNDVMAIAAYNELALNGIRVPENVALSGFDNDFEAMYHVPGITSVARKQAEQGRLACELLTRADGADSRGRIIPIETSGVFRESCGCKSNEQLSDPDFRKLHFAQRDIDEKLAAETRRLVIDLTAVDSFEQLKFSLKRFVSRLACDSFALILSNSVLAVESRAGHDVQEAETLTGEDVASRPATVLLGYENGTFYENRAIGLMEYIKGLDGGASACHVISPLHFCEKVFGCCVIGGCELPFASELYTSWIVNIGSAVQGILKQQLLQRAIRKLDSMWCFDALSGVYNRAGLNQYGGRVWDECLRKRSNALLLFIDLDGLKYINDTYGHNEGDRCIRAIATLLSNIRHHGEVVARYGGDEFVFVSPAGSRVYARDCIRRIQEAIDAYNAGSGLPYELHASIGFALHTPTASLSLDRAIKEADRDMYDIKRQKKRSLQESQSDE